MSVITEPRGGVGLVQRERAVAGCLGATAPILLLRAPAGYGKTTVLSQWTASDPRPATWITADWRHDDPAYLLTCVAEALDAIEPFGDDTLAPLAAPPPNLDLVTSRIGRELGGRTQPFLLVLDDLHAIGDRDSLRLLATVLESVPDGSTVALASRGEPELPLGRWRARRLLGELRPSDLTMSVDEAADLLEIAGLELDPEQLEALVERTEGWPAGLYLAALTVADAADPGASLAALHGDERVVADYLRDEFMSGLSAADRDFLTRTSILDRLNGDLCDAVLARDGSGATLRRLARSNLLLTALDARGRELRYHALLREMLEAEFGLLDRAEQRALHGRASRWHTAAGDCDRAVAHAIAAGDLVRAGELIWDLTPGFESSGRGATLRRWLAEVGEPAVRSSPHLCMTAAAGRATLGDGAGVEAWTSAALVALEGDRSARAAETRGGGLPDARGNRRRRRDRAHGRGRGGGARAAARKQPLALDVRAGPGSRPPPRRRRAGARWSCSRRAPGAATPRHRTSSACAGPSSPCWRSTRAIRWPPATRRCARSRSSAAAASTTTRRRRSRSRPRR